MASWFRRHVPRLVALSIIFGLFAMTRLPQLKVGERDRLLASFGFSGQPLYVPADQEMSSERRVHPSFERISAWISAVGAAVAIYDLDGDGLANDFCHVDPRFDKVFVEPAPNSASLEGPRYEPFTLDASALPKATAPFAPMGCLGGDFNEDGFGDVLVYYWGRSPVLFLNRGDGQSPLSADLFTAQELTDEPMAWNTNAATLADLDGDGHVDLVFGNYFQDGARILDPHGSGIESMQDSMSRAMNGGMNRIFRWRGASRGPTPAAHFEDVEGVFPQDIGRAWTLAIGAADLDGDLLPELYFANDFGPDRLLHNRSTPGHLEFAVLHGVKTAGVPNSKVLGQDSFKGMGVDFGDVNGDGYLDIFVSNIADEYALLESHYLWVSTGDPNAMKHGIAPYVDESEPLGVSRSGWGWDSRLADFNNDGVLEAIQATGFLRGKVDRWPELQELALGNDQLLRDPRSWPKFKAGSDLSGHEHNPFFVRAQDGRYYDLAPELGLGDAQVTRGIAIADVDGDGDLDFITANQWEDSIFYRNECPKPGAFMGLRLLLAIPAKEPQASIPAATTEASDPTNGDYAVTAVDASERPSAGRPAIGASATLVLPGEKRMTAQVDGGNGHSGARSPELHFGLGDLTGNESLDVELRWRGPDGKVNFGRTRLTPGWHTLVLGRDIVPE